MSLQITPDFVPHKTLESDVKSYLESRNYLIYEATYHAIASVETRNILSRRFTPTALYLRGRADRIAIHKEYTFEFEFECKTHLNSKYHDMTLELLPLIHHLSKSKLGVKCLYIYRHKDMECGFWMDELPQIRQIWIPPARWQTQQSIAWFESISNIFFDGIDIVTSAVAGTGDPFLIIDESTVKNLVHWQSLIEFEELKNIT